MVMPRRRSSAQRSGSIPVRARTSVDFPWSTWPAVAITYTVCTRRCGPRSSGARGGVDGGGDDGGDQGVVVGRVDRAQVKQQAALLEPADDGRDLAPADGRPLAERDGEVLVEGEGRARQGDTG